MSRVRRDEGGWVLITALVLMLVMAGFGMALLTFTDNETRQSAAGRQRETAFNVAEAALNAQIHNLSTSWPGTGAAGNAALRYPATCDQTSTDARCPQAATITSLFSSPDTGTPTAWTTTVRDNSGSAGADTFWREDMLATAPTYDANGDGKVWVRGQAVAKGRTRTMVALVRTELQAEDLPHMTLLAGRLDISNLGNKMIIDTKGQSASTGQVAVRCTPSLTETLACLGHTLGQGSLKTLTALTGLLDVQIAPNVSTYGYAGADAAMTAEEIDRLRATAIANGTYYTSCPASLAGSIVFIEANAACSYTSNAVVNTAAAPGAVIMTGGSLSLAGGLVYHGLLYHTNAARLTGNMVSLGGTVEVDGGIIVDGLGTVVAGSSKVNLVFDDRAFTQVRSYGNAGLIQNTWREIS